MNPICSKCNKEMLKSKFGENQFWCPTCRTKFPPKQTQPQKINGDVIIIDEIQAFRKEFNERMDNLAKYLKEKLEK